MGAWGHRSFENDTALDWVAELESTKQRRRFLEKALKVTGDYIEADAASCAIAACEVMCALQGGERDGLPDDVENVIGAMDRKDIAKLNEVGIRALRRILSDGSELRELWVENEGDYPLWVADVEGLIGQLQKLRKDR